MEICKNYSLFSAKDLDLGSQLQIPEIPVQGINQAFEMVLMRIQHLNDSQEERAQNQIARLEQVIRDCMGQQSDCMMQAASLQVLQSWKPSAHVGFIQEGETMVSSVPTNRWSQVLTENLDARPSTNTTLTTSSFKNRIKHMNRATTTTAQKSENGTRVPHLTSSLDHPHSLKSFLQSVVLHPAFDITFGVLIVLNALSIGAETEYKTTHENTAVQFEVVSYTFALVFLIELILRIAANRCGRFFLGRERAWNLFDLFMVLISFFEVFDGMMFPGTSQILQVLRMARLLRVLRVVRFSPQLRMMVFMILESTRATGAVAIFLFTTLYVFSIVFTMGATEYCGVPGSSVYGSGRFSIEIQRHYGTLVRSLYTCFKAITGGVSWGEVMDPLVELGGFYVAVFILFISFSVLALLNIVTSVFVDGTMAKSQNDRDMVVEKKIQEKASIIEHLKQIFEESDADASGEISFEEFQDHMNDPKVEAYMVHLSVDTSNIRKLFDQLDDDGSGSIDLDEFVDNLLQITSGRHVDVIVQKVMNETKRVKKFLMHFADMLQTEVVQLSGNIDRMGAQLQHVKLGVDRLRADHDPCQDVSENLQDNIREGICPMWKL